MIKRIEAVDFEKYVLLKNLKEYKKSPQFLNYLGEIEDFSEEYKVLLVVGSRNHSKEADMILEKFFQELEGQKVVILSGLARGIDSLAHEKALKYGLKTIAIPGSGLNPDVIYPKTNYQLAKQIVENGGLLLSPFENDFKATKWSFPERNQLMVQLSDMVLIVEAREKSGSLITGKMALDLNKDLGVVPNSILNEWSLGSNKLLQSGAFPILSAEDIKDILNLKNESKNTIELNFSQNTKIGNEILKKIKEPISKNDLAEKMNLDLSLLNSELTLLEINGYVEIREGMVYKRF